MWNINVDEEGLSAFLLTIICDPVTPEYGQEEDGEEDEAEEGDDE